MSGLKEKAKFGKDIFKTLADAFRENYDLWNSLQFEEWVRLEDAQKELDNLRWNLQRAIISLQKELKELKEGKQSG